MVNSFRPISEGMKNLLWFLFSYHLISQSGDDLFLECQKIVKLRRESGLRKTDLLQALLNANGEDISMDSLYIKCSLTRDVAL